MARDSANTVLCKWQLSKCGTRLVSPSWAVMLPVSYLAEFCVLAGISISLVTVRGLPAGVAQWLSVHL